MPTESFAETLWQVAERMSAQLAGMRFDSVATHVYNPLEYAAAPYRQYLERYAHSTKRILFLGMNPGPFGMAQTGVPFGEVAAVRDWMGIHAPVGKPASEHPARPVQGFDCPRSEVSGHRLWGLFAARFGEPTRFFQDHFVLNYCPLLFLQVEGKRCRNLTPDKFPMAMTDALYAVCDAHLRAFVAVIQPEHVIGVGKFAERRAELALAGLPVSIGTVLHPSPASPAANRDWAGQATKQMHAMGLWT